MAGMREVTKATPKEAGDGPPSSIKNKMAKKGHKQSGNKKKVAETDAMDQMKQQKDAGVDPFELLMRQASQNAKYTMPIDKRGTVDPGDISNISPDEHTNMPKTRKLA